MLNLRERSKHVKEINNKKMTPPLIIEFSVGDMVKVTLDESKMKELQNCKDCGGYSPLRMQGLLGSCVRVKHISPYCVKVEWENCEFDIHPKLIDPIGLKFEPTNHSYEIRDTHAEELFEAIETENQMLVCEKIKPYLLNTKNNRGRTPVNAACVIGNCELAEMLIQFETGLDIRDNDGNLAVHNCVLSNHMNILKLIIDRNESQLHALTKDGQTLLHLSVFQNNQEITNYLIQKKINIEIKDNSGLMASQYIIASTNRNICTLLAESNSAAPNSFQTMSIPEYTASVLYNKSFHSKNMRSSSADGNTNYYERYIDRCLDQTYNFNTLEPPSVSPLQLSLSTSESTNKSINEDQAKQNECEICCNRIKRVAFVSCGHTSCSECADRLYTCHICKKEIIRKQTIYI